MIPPTWKKNERDPVCEYCSHREFSDSGQCTNCGAHIIVQNLLEWPKKLAITTWRDNPPADISTTCYICGTTIPDSITDLVPKNIVDEIVESSMSTTPEYKIIKKICLELFGEDIQEEIILRITRSKKLNIPMRIPSNLCKLYRDESIEYIDRDPYFCVNCMLERHNTQTITKEEVITMKDISQLEFDVPISKMIKEDPLWQEKWVVNTSPVGPRIDREEAPEFEDEEEEYDPKSEEEDDWEEDNEDEDEEDEQDEEEDEEWDEEEGVHELPDPNDNSLWND